MAAKLQFLLVQKTRTPSPAFEFKRSHFPHSRQNLRSFSTTKRIKSDLGYQSSSSFSFSQNKNNVFLSPSLPRRSNSTPLFTVKSQLNYSLISPHDTWGTWTALISTGAFSIWLERSKIGSALNGALVSTLVGCAASNLGIIPYESPAYSIVLEYLLPLAVSLSLFRANMRQSIHSTRQLLSAFWLGSIAKTIGTIFAYLIVPMHSLGRDSWKMEAALIGRHIGGAAGYVDTAKAFGVSSSVLAAGLAADKVICAVYCTTLFALASKIPHESSISTNDVSADKGSNNGHKLPVVQFATALAVAFTICNIGTFLMRHIGIPGGSLPAITVIVVILATAFPAQFNKLAPAGEAMALILIQIFFIVVGASGNIWSVINTAPSLFMFALVQITIHLVVILGFRKLCGLDLKLLLLASNANFGDSTTAFGVATAKGWSSLMVPAILTGIFGNAVGTFLGLVSGDSALSCLYFIRVINFVFNIFGIK